MKKIIFSLLISVLLFASVFAAGKTVFDVRRPANDGVAYFDTIYAIGFQGDISVDTLLLDRLTIVDSGGTDSIDIYDDDTYAYIITDNSLVINSAYTLTTTGKLSCDVIVLTDSLKSPEVNTDTLTVGGGTDINKFFFGSDTWGTDKTADTVLVTGCPASAKVFITWTAAVDSTTSVYATTTAGALFVVTPIAENGTTYNYLILK